MPSYVPPSLKIYVTSPGMSVLPSYLDVEVTSSTAPSVFPVGDIFDAWCAFRPAPIGIPGNFAAAAYSSYELGVLQSALPDIVGVGGMDNVNWLLNNIQSSMTTYDETIYNQPYTDIPYYTVTGLGAQLFTYGDIQQAISSLLGQGTPPNIYYLGSWDPTRVTDIVAEAQTHDGFVPDVTDGDPNNDQIVVVLDTFIDTDGDGIHDIGETSLQPLMVTVTSAALGDYVWNDVNANGVQDEGPAAGVGGVTVNLVRDLNGDGDFDDPNELLNTTTTDGTGYYKFIGLTPGLDYQVQFVLPNDYVSFTKRDAAGDAQDSDANPADGVTPVVVLAPGEYNQTIDAGLLKAAAIGDYVWCDHNRDGIQNDNEHGVNDVTVTLTGTDVLGNAVDLTTSTDNEGYYLFNTLVPGTYKLTFSDLPDGLMFTTPDQGGGPSQDAKDSDANPATGMTQSVTVGSGEHNLSLDAGLVDEATCITFDFSGGSSTCGDYGNERIYTTSGVTVTATAWSQGKGGNDGEWAAAYLGAYSGGHGVTDSSEGNGGNNTHTVDNVYRDNYVMYQFSKDVIVDRALLGYVVNDSDISVWIGSSVTPIAELNDSVLTQMSFYEENWTDSSSARWANVNAGSVAGNVLIIAANISDGSPEDRFKIKQLEVCTAVDCGPAQPKASIGDRVWLDSNANGIQDMGEAGVVGVTVKLLNSSGGEIGSTITDTNGNYLFSNLTPGDYAIKVEKPVDYIFTTKDAAANSNDANDSDVDTITGKTVNTTLTAGETDRSWDAGLVVAMPGIDIEKTTNGPSNENPITPDYDNEDTANGAGVPILVAGSDVTWTYKVTNTGNTTFERSQISIVDDNGTAGDTSDDLSIGNGITYMSGDNGDDDILGVGESWLYQAIGKVQTLTGGVGASTTLNFIGNSATDGTDGNILNFSAGSVAVKASAFSRDKASGAWADAYLGKYGGGLGVTDSSEGSGGSNMHMVDNVGRDNYVLFEFDNSVVVDTVSLGYVVNDSDMSVWIGTVNNAFNNHLTLSDSVLSGLGFTEVDLTDSSSARTADINNGNVAGNVLVIAAWTGDSTPEDRFKIEKLTVQQVTSGGVYANKATVTALGTSDFDWSHYKNPVAPPPAKASLGNWVWEDSNGNGIQDSGEMGVVGATVKLFSANGTLINTAITDGDGKYLFSGLDAGDYKLHVAKSGYFVSPKDKGTGLGADDNDSDFDPTTGMTVVTTLTPGENDLSWDAGLFKKASVGDKVWDDMNHNNIQDSGEPGIGCIKVRLLDATGKIEVAKTETDSNGNYKFSNLNPGTYVLEFNKANVQYYQYKQWNNMSNWKWAVQDKGNNDSVDSDVAGDAIAKTNISLTKPFTLVSGQNDMTRDAGITPIVIDLDGNGIQTVSRADAAGSFDLFGNGKAVQSGWISGGEGFLALDSNGNGQIDDISELFGGTAKGAGFAQLASYDSNGDGLVDAADSAFADLLIWRDANGNHQSDAGELMTLAEAGVAALDVRFSELPFLDRQGNLHLERSSATMADGRTVDMTDVYFAVAADDAAAAGVALPELAQLLQDGSLPGDGGALIDLSAWRDAGESSSLADAGLAGLNVAFQEGASWDANGELHLEQSSTAGGEVVDITDSCFSVAANDDALMAEAPVADAGWLFA